MSVASWVCTPAAVYHRAKNWALFILAIAAMSGSSLGEVEVHRISVVIWTNPGSYMGCSSCSAFAEEKGKVVGKAGYCLWCS